MSEEIKTILLNQETHEIVKLFQSTKEGNELDLLLQSVVDICKNQDSGNYLLPVLAFPFIGNRFGILSALSAHRHAVDLMGLLRSDNCRSKSTVAALLRLLVESVPILHANKLREFVKSEVMEQCVQFWEAEERDLAAQLTYSVLQTLLAELSYLEGIHKGICHAELTEKAKSIWERLLNLQIFGRCAFLQLSTALLQLAMNSTDHLRYAKNVVKNKLLETCVIPEGNDGDNYHIYCSTYSYNAVLFDLLSSSLSSFCHMRSGKLVHPIFKFLIEHAQLSGTLELFLHNLEKNPIRYSEFADLVESTISMYAPTSSNKTQITWSSELESKETKIKLPKIEGHLNLALLLSYLTNSEEHLADLVANTENAMVKTFIHFTTFDDSQPQLCLRLLNLIAENKKACVIPIRDDFINLMMAEAEPKIYSLKFASKLIERHTHSSRLNSSLEADFVSFCLAIFRPLGQLNCPEAEKRDFLMAELTFLKSLLSSSPQLLSSFAPLIIQLMPEFFVWSTFYQKNLRNSAEMLFADRLEHYLGLVCREIVRRKTYFHKLLPFAISGALVGERELRFPFYLLFSALDENDMALLSSNLPAAEKRKYSLLHAQFYASNKIIG